MRIVGEENQDVLTNHIDSNRLLGATPDERLQYDQMIANRDNLRNPLNPELVETALTKGSVTKDGTCDQSTLLQIKVMYLKRIRQFSRSKGQVVMSLIVPLVVIMLLCFLLSTTPTALLSPSPPSVELPYISTMRTIIAAPSQSYGLKWASDAFSETPYGLPNVSFAYIGSSYSSMLQYVSLVASQENGINSSEAIAYGYSLNNYTIMYNASYPINFAAATSNLLEAGVANATNGALSFIEYCQSLPFTLFGDQVHFAYFTCILFVRFAINAVLFLIVQKIT